MMEYIIGTLVMAIAVLFAATWLTGWDGESEQDEDVGLTFDYGGAQFVKEKGIGPEVKGMYQRVQAGIALPMP